PPEPPDRRAGGPVGDDARRRDRPHPRVAPAPPRGGRARARRGRPAVRPPAGRRARPHHRRRGRHPTRRRGRLRDQPDRHDDGRAHGAGLDRSRDRNDVNDTDRYILISADTHAGAELRAYRPYLEKKWHDDFDAWVAGMDEQAEVMREMMGPRSVGVDGDPAVDGNRNYDSARRLREMESDGMVAEVIFPNTQPPFAPRAGILFAAPPIGDSPEHRWAGLQAHNRWLADFCAEAPGRRAGVAQIMLANVEGSVAEIEWAREHGLFGGVLLPGAPPGSGVAPL